MTLGVQDRLVPRQCQVTNGGDAREVGCKRCDAHLEAHLVVALAGAAVRDGRRPVQAGCRDEMLDDQRARERGHERVAVHVERVGLQRRDAVLLGELRPGIGDVRLDGTARERALADDVEVLAVLADVHRDRDHLRAGCLGDPADGHRGVEAA